MVRFHARDHTATYRASGKLQVVKRFHVKDLPAGLGPHLTRVMHFKALLN